MRFMPTAVWDLKRGDMILVPASPGFKVVEVDSIAGVSPTLVYTMESVRPICYSIGDYDNIAYKMVKS